MRLLPCRRIRARRTGITKFALRKLARRHQFLTTQLRTLDGALKPLVTAAAPQLLGLHAVGIDTAGALLVLAGGNPERLRSEGSFANLCGVAHSRASSGKTQRHDSIGAATAGPTTPCGASCWPAWAPTNAPATTSLAEPAKACPNPRSCAASNASSPARSTKP